MLLLQVMDSLYQARVRKVETDLLIDQLKETFHYLTVQNKVAHPLTQPWYPMYAWVLWVRKLLATAALH